VVRKEHSGCSLAPQSGHVSNFFVPTDIVIEPMDRYCLQADEYKPPTCVHAGCPVWTRLELTREGQDNFRMRREN